MCTVGIPWITSKSLRSDRTVLENTMLTAVLTTVQTDTIAHTTVLPAVLSASVVSYLLGQLEIGLKPPVFGKKKGNSGENILILYYCFIIFVTS